MAGVQTNHLQYYGTLRAIKLYLKYLNLKIPNQNRNPIVTKSYPSTLKAKKGTQAMYYILNQNKDIPTGKLTWNKARLTASKMKTGPKYICFPLRLLNTVVRWSW